MEQMLLRYAKVKCHIKKDLFFEIHIKMINFDDYVNGIEFSENNGVALVELYSKLSTIKIGHVFQIIHTEY